MMRDQDDEQVRVARGDHGERRMCDPDDESIVLAQADEGLDALDLMPAVADVEGVRHRPVADQQSLESRARLTRVDVERGPRRRIDGTLAMNA
ncbi:hypothetical protein [Nannocystis pusilla]|uniref:hypothetical protein n=1 Tax=Nannocystis pusilla TaxID=889268 RepID=UPI003B7D13B9